MNLPVRFPSVEGGALAIARAVACSVPLVLPSCQIPHLRQADPGSGLPAEYQPVTADPTAVVPAAFTTATTSTAQKVEGPANPVAGPGAAPAPPAAPAAGGPPGPGPSLPAGSGSPPGPENSGRLGVEAFFNDPVLTQLIGQALAGNRELRALDEEIQLARTEVLARRGAYLPFVTFGAGASLDRPSLFTPEGAVDRNVPYLPGEFFPEPRPNFLAAFNLAWTPDIFRALRNARDAATQRFLAAAERRNDFVTRMVAEIAESYYRLMSLDKRLENLEQTIALQQQSLDVAEKNKAAGRDTELPVQRFLAEVRRNQSEILIVRQEIIEVENRINFLANRLPQPVERASDNFFDLTIQKLCLGVPADLLQNRPDIRRAERELAAAGLDVKVARARFFPSGAITGRVGYEAFHPKYFFDPEAVVANVAGDLVAPVLNKAAIRADYLGANARQLQAVYNYQRVVLNAYTEVINRLSMVENYTKSLDLRRQQMEALASSVDIATKLFQAARKEYIEVLFAQRDLRDARMTLIDTKRQQLAAVVNTYQALGGGDVLRYSLPDAPPARGWSLLRWMK